MSEFKIIGTVERVRALCCPWQKEGRRQPREERVMTKNIF